MIGDKSDGIKGVEGIGPKRAKELWEKYSQTLAQLVQAPDKNCPLSTDDPWLRKVYEDHQTLRLNWRLLKIGELITNTDLEKAENLITEPIKLFNAEVARFYIAQKGWFSVLKEWPQVVKAFQQILI
jgi:5'-3' exonuclease